MHGGAPCSVSACAPPPDTFSPSLFSALVAHGALFRERFETEVDTRWTVYGLGLARAGYKALMAGGTCVPTGLRRCRADASLAKARGQVGNLHCFAAVKTDCLAEIAGRLPAGGPSISIQVTDTQSDV